jgi:hypothetical protein
MPHNVRSNIEVIAPVLSHAGALLAGSPGGGRFASGFVGSADLSALWVSGGLSPRFVFAEFIFT